MNKTAAIAAAIAVALGLSACGDDPEPEAAPVVEEDTAGEDAGVVDVSTDFHTLDANGDSYLDIDEVAEWVDDAGVFGEWDIDADSELDTDEITGNAFELWDTDGNGTVSQEEWESGVELWFPDLAPVVFSDLDSDGDSELDIDEFSERIDLSPVGESWTADSFDEETFKAAYFELYDTDNDGRVSDSEWTSGAATFGAPND